MSNKMIFVSNRLPVTIIRDDGKFEFQQSIGGLATGLKSIHEGEDSLWVGWCGIKDEELTGMDKKFINDNLYGEYKCAPVFLTEDELDKYYYGFSNNTIWPLFHYFAYLTVYEPELWEGYREANLKYLECLKKHVKNGDTVWIHDYQLMLLPKMLKEAYSDVKIGYFHHIPFPSFEIFRLLPWRSEILEGLLGADLIGFHTYDYVRHFVSSVRRLLGFDYNLGLINLENRIIKVDAYPMGINYDYFSTAHKSQNIKKEAKEFVEKTKGMKIILSVDRLDYSKGIVERVKSYNLFLARYPEYKEKVTLIMIVAPSRTSVEAYKDLLREIEELVSHTNGEHGTIGWMPVWFFFRAFSTESLIALYGMADVMLVTPFRDGMNLIAKEYIAARVDRKGVLVLSETAGAASELGEAVMVNPNNRDEIARGIKTALELPEEERIERNTVMHDRLKRYDVFYWAKDFMNALNGIEEIQANKLALKLNQKVENKIIGDYKRSAHRLIFLDYDGTLIRFFPRPHLAKPDEELLSILEKLAEDPKNTVVLISGRDKNTLQNWFGKLNIHLVGQHGMWIKEHGGEWMVTEKLNNDWKENIRPVLEIHTSRTPGSFIEEKDHSLAWHYRKCDPDLAALRVGELKEALMDLTRNLNIGLLDGKKVIEVKDTTINKGRGVSYWLGRKEHEFIICMGDDWTDEDMFHALPSSAYSIRVGLQLSAAQYAIESVDRVRALLVKLVD